jgi:hypothetical protein
MAKNCEIFKPSEWYSPFPKYWATSGLLAVLHSALLTQLSPDVADDQVG